MDVDELGPAAAAGASAGPASAAEDVRMEQTGGADSQHAATAAHGSSSSPSPSYFTAAAAASSPAAASLRPSDWRPAVRHDYESSTISATHPIAARRFDSLTPAQYEQQYAARTAQFERGIPIVIDNGSYELRAGFSIDADPRLSYRSLVGRPRNRKEGDFVLVGPQLIEGDQYAPQRIKVRSPFEQNLVTQYDLMEYLFDYTFSSLGLTTSIPHPVFLTEPLCNPNYCRGKMSELLLECYGVEGVGYALPEAAVWHYNSERDRAEGVDGMDGDVTGDALVVQCGYESSTLVPIVDSRPLFAHASRLSVGGAQLSTHLTHALLHVQHPQHAGQINAHRVQELVERYCQTAPDRYEDTLNAMALLYDVNGHSIPDGVPASANVPEPVIVQLPFTPAAASSSSASAAASAAEAAAKKEQNRARLRALMADRKEKKLAEDQEILADWSRVRADFHAKLLTPSEFLRQLKRRTFVDENDFSTQFEKLRRSVEARLAGQNPEEVAAALAESVAAANALKSDAELYPLLSRPDAELSAEEIKEKARQKRLKQAAEQQAVRRKEKEMRLLQEKQQREMEAQEYASDPVAFIASLHRARQSILASREERQRVEADVASGGGGASGAGGRRSAAARKRAALLATMGGSGGSIESIEKNARKDRAAFAREASFGTRDEDWGVYEQVRLPGADVGGGGRNDSDDERDALGKIDAKIAQYDPASLEALQQKPAPVQPTPQDFQFALWVDRVRLPEMLFQPQALLGVEESGVGEMMRRMLLRMEPEQATRVVKNVLVCGGTSLFPHFLDRLRFELRQLRPVGSTIRVRHAREPQWDAWRGAASLCNSTPFGQLFITRAEWEEQGIDYLKEHALSNTFLSTAPDEAIEAAKRRKR